jgi:hypothetical protein
LKNTLLTTLTFIIALSSCSTNYTKDAFVGNHYHSREGFVSIYLGFTSSTEYVYTWASDAGGSKHRGRWELRNDTIVLRSEESFEIKIGQPPQKSVDSSSITKYYKIEGDCLIYYEKIELTPKQKEDLTASGISRDLIIETLELHEELCKE